MMDSSTKDPNETQTDEEDTYRLMPVEPSPVDPPADVVPEDDVWLTSGPAGEKPKRRKRKRKRKSPSDEPANEPASTLADEFPEWTADSGWRERSLISAVWFPFTGSGMKLLPPYIVMLWVGAIFPIPFVGALIGMFVLVYLSVLLLETSNYTLEGIPLGPQVPEWMSWDTISVGLMGLIVFLTAGLPMVIGSAVMSRMPAQVPWVVITLMSAGFFYIPMGFLALAGIEDEKALNPLCVFRGMRKMLLPYLVLCGIAAAVFLIPLYLLLMFEPPVFVLKSACVALLVSVSASLMRAVALVARGKGLTFEDESEDREASDVV